MRWPYSPLVLILGLLGIAVFYSLQFYQNQPKQLLDYARLILLTSFLLHYIFRVFHLEHGYIFTAIMQLTFVVFLILYGRDVLFIQSDAIDDDVPITKTKVRQKALTYLLYGLATVGILIGALFKILHWQFGFVNGNILLTIGLLAAAGSVFVGASPEESK